MIGHVGDFGLVPEHLKFVLVINQAPPQLKELLVILLQAIERKRPTDDMFQGSSNLQNFVKEALPTKQVVQIVDPILVQEKLEGEMSANNHLVEDSRRIHIKIEESLTSILVLLVLRQLDISAAMAGMCRIRKMLQESRIFE
ncbi:unnamed protein product [Prunus armeniaca]